MRSDFCTYVHLRPDGSPFYIGKGTIARARWKKRRANQHHQNIVAKHGLNNITVRIIKSGLTEERAFAYERHAIECLRDFGYELCNLTDGGEGASGWVAPQEVRDKMSVTRKGRKGTPHSAEIRLLISEKAKLRPPRLHTKESKEKISQSHKGKKFTEAHRAAIRRAAQNRSPEAREKNRIAHLGKIFTAESKAKSSASHKGILHTEETKAKMSELAKALWAKRKGLTND